MNAAGSSSQTEFDYLFKLLLIGDSGVGNSSLLLSFTSNSFEDLSPTIGTAMGHHTVWTLLHVSVRKGDFHERLLEDGADANVAAWGPQSKGVTPLHPAAEGGHNAAKDINDTRFNPALHYCPGLEWAYKEMERLQQGNTSSC